MTGLALMIGAGVPLHLDAPDVDGRPAREARSDQLAVELIATPTGRLKDMREVWLGVRFTLRDKWHIYWTNPGDSGGPPTVTWQLPDDVTAGVLEWPMPTRLPLGPLLSYGYEEEVVLPVRLRVGRRASRARTLPIVARVAWHVGRDICLSGNATLAITLPLRGAAQIHAAEWAQEIQAARATVPKAAPATWRVSAESRRDSFQLTVDTGTPIEWASFLPLRESQIDNAAMQEAKRVRRAIQLRLRKSNALRDSRLLKGVLVVPSGSFEITAFVHRSLRERQ